MKSFLCRVALMLFSVVIVVILCHSGRLLLHWIAASVKTTKTPRQKLVGLVKRALWEVQAGNFLVGLNSSVNDIFYFKDRQFRRIARKILGLKKIRQIATRQNSAEDTDTHDYSFRKSHSNDNTLKRGNTLQTRLTEIDIFNPETQQERMLRSSVN